MGNDHANNDTTIAFSAANCASRRECEKLWPRKLGGRERRVDRGMEKYETTRHTNFETSRHIFLYLTPPEKIAAVSCTYAPTTAQILNEVWELLPAAASRIYTRVASGSLISVVIIVS